MQMTALKLASILAEAGLSCAIVGGAVRDSVYGLKSAPKDFDIIVFSEAGLSKLTAHLERDFGLEESTRLEDSSSGNSDDDDFASCWADWRAYTGDFNVDVLLPIQDEPSAGDSIKWVRSGESYEYWVTSNVLAKFDCNMNQQALIINRGKVDAVLVHANECRELKPLPDYRVQRMRKKADILGLNYVSFQKKTISTNTYAEEGDF